MPKLVGAGMVARMEEWKLGSGVVVLSGIIWMTTYEMNEPSLEICNGIFGGIGFFYVIFFKISIFPLCVFVFNYFFSLLFI